jgi:uncharacterized LabA/DUF88 family protein
VKRVAVFIDYQNCYRRARDAFFPTSDNHTDGQIDPLRLGLKLKGDPSRGRELVGVHLFRGLPSSRHDPVGQAATDRQIELWKRRPLVTVHGRPLNYRDPQNPREKGVDVHLAVAMVRSAYLRAYDIAVLVSEDTDLIPALDAVSGMPRRRRGRNGLLGSQRVRSPTSPAR